MFGTIIFNFVEHENKLFKKTFLMYVEVLFLVDIILSIFTDMQT